MQDVFEWIDSWIEPTPKRVWDSAERALNEKQGELARAKERIARCLYLAYKHEAEARRAHALALSSRDRNDIDRAKTWIETSRAARARYEALRGRADREIEELLVRARQIAALEEAAYG